MGGATKRAPGFGCVPGSAQTLASAQKQTEGYRFVLFQTFLAETGDEPAARNDDPAARLLRSWGYASGFKDDEAGSVLECELAASAATGFEENVAGSVLKEEQASVFLEETVNGS